MDYQTFVTTQFIPRVTGLLTGLMNNLKGSGVSNVTVQEMPTNDIRWRITATKGNRTFIGYVELTSAGVVDGAMGLQITLYIEGNGNQMSHSYVVGNPVRYDDEASMALLMNKLTSLEGMSTGELLTNAKAFLRV